LLLVGKREKKGRGEGEKEEKKREEKEDLARKLRLLTNCNCVFRYGKG
jgi:hypothetical protein